jgi:predicted RNA-binding Zn-ribbon protein involved in translation (DUF1610 family)
MDCRGYILCDCFIYRLVSNKNIMNMDVGDTLSETITIKARRVYKCPTCGLMLERKSVYKKDGIYYCNSDHGIVKDVTDTTTGHDFMEILGI